MTIGGVPPIASIIYSFKQCSMNSSDMKITIIRDNRNRTPGKPGAEYIYIQYICIYI